jgi:hypothetical protein
MTNGRENKPVDESAVPTGGDVDESRRAAFLRLAKYTAPVMLALLLSEKAATAQSAP